MEIQKKDITVTKHYTDGFTCSYLADDNRYYHQRYIGYNISGAKDMFIDYVRDEMNKENKIYNELTDTPSLVSFKDFSSFCAGTISCAIKNGSCVLYDENSKINYSCEANKGTPFAALTQLYLQQLRKENGWKSPLFITRVNNLNLKNEEKGTLVVNACETPKLYYNYDQLYDDFKEKERGPLLNIPGYKPGDLSLKKFQEMSNPYKKNLTFSAYKYFESIFLGLKYTPTDNIKDAVNSSQEQIASCINNGYRIFKYNLMAAKNNNKTIVKEKVNNKGRI